MKFKTFLNEKTKLIKNFNEDDIADVLVENCSAYIHLLKSKGINAPFIRRIWQPIIHVLPPLLHGEVHKDRTPQGHPGTFALLNNWLQKNKHCRRDKSVIAISKEKNFASVFGNLSTLIFPIGNFDYSFVRSADIHLQRTVLIEKNMKKEKIEKLIDIIRKGTLLFRDELLWIFFSEKIKKSVYETMYNYPPKEVIDEVKKVFPSYFETNENIEEAFQKEYEIWFDCDDYYLLNTNLLDKTKNILKKLGLSMPKGKWRETS